MITRRDFLKTSAALAAGASLGGILSSCSGSRAKNLNKISPREAMFYKKLGNKVVQCQLCPWGCQLTPGSRGRCGVRENREGTLYSLVWGKPVAIHVDPVEKKPLYHFLPGKNAFSMATVGCNFHCVFCQNWEISQASPGEVPYYEATPQKITARALKENSPIIAYTYTEPIVFYEYMHDTALESKKKGLKNVMISAGFIRPKPLEKLCNILDAIKIDLKSFSEDFYENLVNGRLAPVLRTLKTIRKSGTWLEIVNLVIPGKNDDPETIKNMASWIKKNLGSDVPVHFTRFIPMYKLVNVPVTPVSTLEKCRNVARKVGLNYVYVGNVPGHPGNSTYCPNCGKIVIERKGYRVKMSGLRNGKCKYCGKKIPGVWS